MPTVSYCLVPSENHMYPGHPESPARFSGLPRVLSGYRAPELIQETPLPVPKELLGVVHTPEHLARLEAWCRSGPAIIDPAPTYVTRSSFEAAMSAAGGGLAVLDSVLRGRSARGAVLARPPGHHATADRAMGFCLLNTVAILARAAQSKGLARILIIDFDVHHGNGTQSIVERDPQVVYFSSHQSGIYPGTGAWDEVGAGNVVNLPLPAGAGDRCFEQIGARLIDPLARRHAPDLILVSAGFDAHWRDPLAGLQVTLAGFDRLIRLIVGLAEDLCGGKIVFVTEGGYDAEVLAAGVDHILAALTSRDSPVDRLGAAAAPEPDVTMLLNRSLSFHRVSP